MTIIQINGAPALSLAAILVTTASTVPAAEPAEIYPPSGRVPVVHLGPRMLDPVEHRIGTEVGDLELTGIDGKQHRLYETESEHGTVVIVRDPECPVSKRYGPRIKRMATQYEGAFRFVFIYPNVDLTAEQRAEDARMLGVQGIYAQRGSFALAEALGVNSTGDVFVLDDQHRLRYRGAVDDQYGLGYTRDVPTTHYLRNALDEMREHRPVGVPATSAPGCYIDADPNMDRQIPLVPGDHLLSYIVTRGAHAWEMGGAPASGICSGDHADLRPAQPCIHLSLCKQPVLTLVTKESLFLAAQISRFGNQLVSL